jgi:hypothetical protein
MAMGGLIMSLGGCNAIFGIHEHSYEPADASSTDSGAPPIDATTDAAPAKPSWKIVGTGDFDRDGRPDILWQGEETRVWYMRGASRVGHTTIVDANGTDASLGTVHEIVGTADFDDDGAPDILAVDPSSGELEVWYVRDAAIIRRVRVDIAGATMMTSPWAVVAVNDFDSDGQPDIVWHDDSSGETRIWFMHGTSRSKEVAIVDPSRGELFFVGPPWHVVGSGDFDKDGYSDLVWHNESTGETQVWFMRDATLANRGTVDAVRDGNGAFVTLPWAIVGVNDFGEDATPDILWHNDATGETQLWFMEQTSRVGRATVDAVLDDGGVTAAPP